MDEQDYAVPGFDAAGVAAGIKKHGGLDLALIASRVPCAAAAIFTQNLFPAAPVLHGRRLLAFNNEAIHGVVINSGCANACTGIPGSANTRLTAEAVEQSMGASDNTIFVMSTGVIGVQLPMEQLLGGVAPVVEALAPDGWPAAARAIMTTDTLPKLETLRVTLPGAGADEDAPCRITGIAKGAGMIHPNMATMLAVIATDAAIAPGLLQRALEEAASRSFNRISIDGDTSTNDGVILLANGLCGNAPIQSVDDPAYAPFVAALTGLCAALAQAIVRDGEGATKFVAIHVQGAADAAQAHAAANTVATSPLVKTALFGGDANWGRILAAVGRSGAIVEPLRTALYIDGGPMHGPRLGELQLVEAGTPLAYSEAKASTLFAQPEIDLRIELGLGDGGATVWTSDLSYDYVRINGDYRT
jgi:glutamate N-acetyltransferase/amino-acid N-acetyltransferase